LGTNLPGAVADPLVGLGDGLAAEAVTAVKLYTTAPATPPTSIEPAIAAATAVLRIPFTVVSLLGFIRSIER
jgi:hypothetical protein